MKLIQVVQTVILLMRHIMANAISKLIIVVHTMKLIQVVQIVILIMWHIMANVI